MDTIKVSENVSLSRVVAGCMRIVESGIDGDGLREFVNSCLDMGVDTFDHAPVYGAGKCEAIFGEEVIAKNPEIRGKIKLVTKAGIILPGQYGNNHIFYDSTKENLEKEIDMSLKRLNTDHIDLYLIHRPDILGDPAVIGECLDSFVKSGKVLSVGVSNYEPMGFDSLQSHMSTKLVANQMEFSVKSTYNFFNGVSDHAFKNGVSLMAWSPLGGGSVFKGTDERMVAVREAVTEIAKAHGTDMDTVMYAWLLMHPVNMMVITGSMNKDRIKKACDALSVKLSYDEWYGILAASRGFDVP